MKRAANNPAPHSRERERGAVVIEFAIVLPILALLLGGGIEFGLLARDHQVLQNAAREGARFSVLPANNIAGAPDAGDAAAIEARIRAHVQAYLQNEGITTIPDADITVNQDYTLMINGITVRGSEIVIVYAKSLVLPGMNLLADPVNLTGRAVFRNFY